MRGGQVIFQQPDDFLFIILVARLLTDGLSRIFLIIFHIFHILVMRLSLSSKELTVSHIGEEMEWVYNSPMM